MKISEKRLGLETTLLQYPSNDNRYIEILFSIHLELYQQKWTK